VHGVDAGPVHLGDVGRVAEDEGDRPEDDRAVRDAVDPERGHAEAEEEEHEQDRDAAEQVDVDGREDPDREQRRAAAAAGEGEQQREDQDEELGDEEDPDVQPERREDVLEGGREVLAREERLPDLVVALGVDDDDGEQAEDDDRAGGRDRGGSPAVRAPPAVTR
jgi:hypothetical protein